VPSSWCTVGFLGVQGQVEQNKVLEDLAVLMHEIRTDWLMTHDASECCGTCFAVLSMNIFWISDLCKRLRSTLEGVRKQ
jgi:hypothetical protein